ncbi:MAG: universal stress protein [Pseudomonadota bacterium]
MTRVGEKRYLVLVDGSGQSLAAARYMGRMLAGKPAEMVLFHVYSAIPEAFWDLAQDPLLTVPIEKEGGWEVFQRRLVHEFMEEAKGGAVQSGMAPEAIRVVVKDKKDGISRDIIAEARQGYEGAVLGRTGLSNLKRLILGSNSSKVLGGVGPVSLGVCTGRPEGRGALIGLDPSEGAMKAVAFAGQFLAGTQDPVVLFHAVRALAPLGGEGKKEYDGLEKILTMESAALMAPVFDKAKKMLIESGIREGLISIKAVSRASSRAWAIVSEAKSSGRGTIILGRRGMSKVREFMVGRVSNKTTALAENACVFVAG